MPVVQETAKRAARTPDQADRDARDHALRLGASGRGEVRRQARLAKCDNEQARAQQQKAGHN
jgi:hypothetical protein